MQKKEIEIVEFQNRTKAHRSLLKQFVRFHWSHYRDEANCIPLLDYEYLGFRLLGIHGFFEPQNLFFKHAEMTWFLARIQNRFAGRCIAYINRRHNRHWNDKAGFFGLFESIDNQDVASGLIEQAKLWLKKKGADAIRGPVNLPVNEATPGIMTEGFDSRPVMYYHYNKPYYERLLLNAGLEPVKRVKSWEIEIAPPLPEKIERLAPRIIDRYHITIENWGERPLHVRKEEMRIIYNEAWSNNWGFVPFTQEEFDCIVDDMMLIMNRQLFVFLYVRQEPAAFFGAVPNVVEHMKPGRFYYHCELIRALRMLLGSRHTKGIRLGYLGVRPKFRHLGLDGVMIWKQKRTVDALGYRYCDAGWVLDDNVMLNRVIDLIGAKPSKTYTVFESAI
ncbi:hypothetical protein JW948_04045 [bacterium]|nr:hypothetical protein [bacterium]